MGRGSAEPGQDGLHGLVEPHAARLHEGHERGHGEQLGHRGQVEQRVCVNRLPPRLRVEPAVAGGELNLPGVQHDDLCRRKDALQRDTDYDVNCGKVVWHVASPPDPLS
jgi:hypothetical protein